MFCALHDQLASLDRHTQPTRCFSAVAELLVVDDDDDDDDDDADIVVVVVVVGE